MYARQPVPWTYIPPKDKKKCETQKMFALERPYKGIRLNSAMLAMPVAPSKKYVRGLMAMTTPIPDNFSWRADTTRIEQAVRDQGLCGGCWAFSITSALGDRYSIKYNIEPTYPSSAWLIINGKPPDVPSFLECETGGNTFTGSQWVENYGVKLSSCWPYSIIRDKGKFVSPNQFYRRDYYTNKNKIMNPLYENCCYDCCSDDIVKQNRNLSLYIKKGSTKYIVVLNNNNSINEEQTTAAIQREIKENGPVVAAFKVYGDFMRYWEKDAPLGKIYIPSSTLNPNGNHAIVLTGWGTETDPRDPSKKIRYWEVRNSWGQTGDKGFCKFAFSLDTPRKLWTCIDIPQNYRGQWLGGVVAFAPGDLPPKNNFKKIGETLRGTTDSSQSQDTGLGVGYIVLIAVAILLFLIFLGYIFFNSKTSVAPTLSIVPTPTPSLPLSFSSLVL